ncbi:MAG: hypothetical protein MUF07_14205 [Steroidobacteraceae bacterium]|nr:hypothetical protein [Steroidobacteraceae bacterium]
MTAPRTLAGWLLLWLLAFAGPQALAQTTDVPVTRAVRLTGKINFVTTGGSLRNQPNTGNACAVGGSSTATLGGIPAGTTVIAAYLYWGGSANTTGGGRPVVDSQVTLNGAAVTASRSFTGNYDNGGTLFPFFGAVADVTARVTGNGSFTFGGLTVNTGAPHCASQAVLAGWALVVIYQGSNERLRAINVFDGLQFFRGSSLTLTPDGFRIPASNIDGRVAVITWEGDPQNSDPLNGFAESLRFNGSPVDDGLVPAGSSPTVQQFDGTISSTGSTTSHGVDVDQYDVTSLLGPGQESATTVYSAGGDLVLLAAQVVSVTSEPKVDLRITKTAAAPFFVGQNGSFTLRVTNGTGAGLEREDNPIVVTDVLPAGLGFVSASGSGWGCSASGQAVTCTRPPPLDAGQAAPDLTLTVAVTMPAAPSVGNTARVTSLSVEEDPTDNASTVVVPVIAPALRAAKLSELLSDPVNGTTLPKRIPGAIVRYAVTVTNDGTGSVDDASLVLTDPIPAGTALVVAGPGGPPVEFVDGSPASGLAFSYPASVTFSSQPGGGPPFTYVPVPDADGVDRNVTGLRVAPSGTMAASGAGGSPSFTVRFRVRIR